LLLFVIVRLEKALMPAVIVAIVANRGLLEREFDRVGGQFIHLIEKRILILV